MKIILQAATSVTLALLFSTSAVSLPSSDKGNQDPEQSVAGWQSAGQNLSNTRQQPNETIINPSNVNKLKVKWTFTTGGDISATPTVADGSVYVPDWAGNLFAVQKETGKLLWQHKVSEYDGMSGSMSRVSPLVLGDEVVIGDNVINQTAQHIGASVIAVDRKSGILKWSTRVDEHPSAIITGSPVAFNNVIYVGVSSIEEGLADRSGYDCCTFRGSLVALEANTGKIIWKTYTVPDNQGVATAYSGGAIWQAPAIDPARSVLYVGTGNNYTVPPGVEDCETIAILDQDSNSNACTPKDDHFDSVMALDLVTGAVRWAKKFKSYDTWTVACIAPGPGVACPSPAGPDYDFGGSGPNLVDNMVGFGQKSGIYWALNPDNGKILWSTIVGPGSSLGGIEWGTASDGKRIYVPIANKGQVAYNLAPSGPSITWGSWAGLDAKTGKILWQIADPTAGSIDTGAASVANGVVFVGSYSGMMYALDAKTGAILWNFASGGTVVDGPSIVDGVIYWGSGYKRISPGRGNNKLYAFSLGG